MIWAEYSDHLRAERIGIVSLRVSLRAETRDTASKIDGESAAIPHTDSQLSGRQAGGDCHALLIGNRRLLTGNRSQ